MMSLLTMPASLLEMKRNIALGKLAKPGAVSPHARVSTFATAKSNNCSSYISLVIQKFLPEWKIVCVLPIQELSVFNEINHTIAFSNLHL